MMSALLFAIMKPMTRTGTVSNDLAQQTVDDLTKRLADPLSKGFRKTVESIVVEQLLDVDSDLSHALAVALQRHEKENVGQSFQSSNPPL